MPSTVTIKQGHRIECSLVGFYSQDMTQDLALAPFSTDDVLLVTGKFQIVEDVLVSKIVHLPIDPSELPVFSILLNTTAVTIESPQIETNDITLTVEAKDYMDQDNITIRLECYHLKSAQHLIPTSSAVKIGSVLFISGKFMIVDDTYMVHLRSVNFVEYQKSSVNSINLKTSANLPWLNEAPVNESTTESVARTIASRVKTGR
ncbi:15136_t:CDS:2 [Cetraspora pellucida]|uniref:15136_t:CDS:1 n=1 Tax=Cetraspora pellucida TaxID=1433469 RepID=A0A9N9AN29_9GLOM|nr:15136_t:CDS:2 [Cetraspora pellucida]